MALRVRRIKKAFGFFSRRRRAMPFAVRFVRRRRTQQKKHKGLRQGGCANLRRKMACRLCFALPRCVRVKKTEGRSAARRYALRPLALAKWRQHLPRGFARNFLAGTSFSSLCRTLRLFCSDGICSLFCTACKNTPAYGAGAEARFVYVLVCGLR